MKVYELQIINNALTMIMVCSLSVIAYSIQDLGGLREFIGIMLNGGE